MTADTFKSMDSIAAQIVAKLAARPRVVTTFVYPPIPTRTMDWCAWYDGDEPNDNGQMATGHGATEQAAIDDLLDNHPRD